MEGKREGRRGGNVRLPGTYGVPARNSRSRRNRLRRRKRMLAVKFLLAVLGGLFLLLAGIRSWQSPGGKQRPEGEYITLQEAVNLTWLLADEAGIQGVPTALDGEQVLTRLQRMSDGADRELVFSRWEELCAMLGDCGYRLPRENYHGKDPVLSADWYAYFDEARKVWDPAGSIRDLSLTVLGIGGAVTDGAGKTLAESELLSKEARYTFYTERLRDARYRPLTAVGRDGELYAVRAFGETEDTLSNVWLMEETEGVLRCFFQDYEIEIPAENLTAEREQVTDLFFAEGKLVSLHQKKEKISGRLLEATDAGVEIEGVGFVPFAENRQCYRLYGGLKSYAVSDLCIGYAFTDFVIENGELAAALVTKEERMESIRVLVKTSDFGSAYHESLVFQPDCDLRILCGRNAEEELGVVKAGETLTVTRESELLEQGRIVLEPSALTGRTALLNVERNQGVPSYRGVLEVKRTEDGLLLINEVLLEEYLYAVVPSEMPAGYPLEALKAQAVCARTYAYQKMKRAGLPSYGAHVDDSAGFQVYNNIIEHTETTRAVGETKGQVLGFGEGLAETYYYSTSCGYGTDAGVWLNGSVEAYPYLQAKALAADAGKREASLLCEEEAFRSYISQTADTDYEKEEGWYRWTYESSRLDAGRLKETIRKRYAANPDGVLTRLADGSFGSIEPPDPGRIVELAITKRGPGGVAQELLIRGEEAELLIRTEHNIRYVLCDGETKVRRQSQDEVSCPSMLPSAFFVLDAETEGGFVTGYRLTGGGFGHGVGLSQNGARNMAAAGLGSEEILQFFFEGCRIRNVYEENQGE